MDLYPDEDDAYNGDIRDLHAYLVDLYFSGNGGLIGFVLETYNNFLRRLPYIFEATRFDTPSGVFRLVHGCEFEKDGKVIQDDVYVAPSVAYGTSQSQYPCFPGYMRLTNRSYMAKLMMRVTSAETDDKITKDNISKLITVVNFPIMLRSEICNLNRITESNKTIYEKYPELDDDPGGYFIIHGRERCIPWQQRLIFGGYITWDGGETKPVTISIVFKTDSTSKMIEIKRYDKSKRKYFVLNYSSVKSSDNPKIPRGINLYMAFCALGYRIGDGSLQKLLMKVIPEDMDIDFLPTILTHLEDTVFEGERIIQNTPRTGPLSPIDLYIVKNDQEASIITSDLLRAREIASLNFMRDLFPHVDIEETNRKAQMLAFMTVRLFQHIIYPDKYPADDKNDDANIQYQSPGIVIEKLIQQMWGRLVKLINEDITKKHPVKAITLDTIAEIIHSRVKDLDKVIDSSFNGSIWGSTISPARNVVQDLNRDAFNTSIIGQLTRVVIESKVRGGKEGAGKKGMESRMIRGAQLGTICIMQTPDTHDVGLTGNLSYLARVSDEVDVKIFEESLFEAFGDDIKIRPVKTYKTDRLIFINGIAIGWGNVDELFHVIRDFRRNGKLYASYDEDGNPVPYFELGLQINNENLYLRVSSGRGLGARLIVYYKEVVLDDVHFIYQYIKSPENKTWEELLMTGVVEYLDPAELAEVSLHDSYKAMLIANDEVESLYEKYIEPNTTEAEKEIIRNKIEEINRESIKTHISLTPDEIYGHTGAAIPYANRIMAPRIPLECKMKEQKMTNHPATIRKFWGNTKIRTLLRGDAPLVYTSHGSRLGFDKYHVGSMVRVAFLPFEANQEDSVVWNSSSLDKFFRQQTIVMVTDEETTATDMRKILYKPVALVELFEGNSELYYDLRRQLYLVMREKSEDVDLMDVIQRRISEDSEKFKVKVTEINLDTLRMFERLHREEERKTAEENPKDNYDHLDIDGLPQIGAKLKEGQIIIGFLKVQPQSYQEMMKKREEIYNLQDKIAFYKDAIAFLAKKEEKMTETKTKSQSKVKKSSIIEIPQLGKKPLTEEEEKKKFKKIIDAIDVDMILLQRKYDSTDDYLVKANKILDKIKDKYHGALADIRTAKEDISGSVRVKFGQDGEVERVAIVSEGNLKLVKVAIVQNRRAVEGNKEDSENSQKATIGAVLNPADLPFIASTGQPADVYLNPLSMPGRMTLAWLLGILVGKVDAMSGTRTNADDFKEFDFDRLVKRLKAIGFNSRGTEKFINPYNGKTMKGLVFTGPSFRSALKHVIYDKMGYSDNDSVSSRDIVSGQTHKGRGIHGGYRFAQMERDSADVSGTASLTKSLMTDSRGSKWTVYCLKCGVPANFTAEPAAFHCPRCKGNDFGRAYIPYAFLNFVHFLAAAGIVVSIRFDKDNDEFYIDSFDDANEEDEDEDEEDEEDDEFYMDEEDDDTSY